MPYNDAYPLFYENRAIGQSTPVGYSMRGRYPFGEIPYQYFENRAVGQNAMPMAKSKFFGLFDVEPKRAFTTGWTTPKQPVNNLIGPNTVYGANGTGIKIHHIIIGMAIAAIVVVIVVKKVRK